MRLSLCTSFIAPACLGFVKFLTVNFAMLSTHIDGCEIEIVTITIKILRSQNVGHVVSQTFVSAGSRWRVAVAGRAPKTLHLELVLPWQVIHVSSPFQPCFYSSSPRALSCLPGCASESHVFFACLCIASQQTCLLYCVLWMVGNVVFPPNCR
jgi:hypothetical protein